MSCVIGLGNVITLISCENALYYKKPIQYLYLLKKQHVLWEQIQLIDERSRIGMQKEFKYLACDEELTSEHVGGKNKIKHVTKNKSLNMLE